VGLCQNSLKTITIPSSEIIRQRFIAVIEEIKFFILFKANSSHETNVSDAVDRLVQGNGRIALFKAQAILRLYAEHPALDSKAKSKLINLIYEIKNLENLLGAFVDAQKMMDSSELAGVPLEYILKLAEKRDAARSLLVARLVESQWLLPRGAPYRNWNAVTKDLLKQDPGQDSIFIRKVLSHYILEVNRFLYEIEKWKWKNTEKLSHPLRRKLRWILLSFQSLNGLVQWREDKRQPYYDHEMILSQDVDKYMQLPLPPSAPFYSIFASRSLGTTITLVTFMIGVAKDYFEMQSTLTELFANGSDKTLAKNARREAEFFTTRRFGIKLDRLKAVTPDAVKVLKAKRVLEKLFEEIRQPPSPLES
jgi:hypothetical protein